MKAPRSMHRLLVGDVGAGKTVVAFLAAACAIEAGFQVAFMAPTEILAEQHLRTLTALGAPAGIVPALWTGSTPARARRELAARLRLPAGDPGALDLLVGTHALLEDEVPLPRLGLVVVDEQHRFGVRQRAQLAAKGSGFPDVLVMTATPIPRTLALACFGDLDVSVLDERPKHRQPVTTRLIDESRREALYGFLAGELARGRQAYVVYPLIDESEKSELRAARAMVQSLAGHPRLAGFTWGLLHGRMKPAEKEAVMKDFAANRVQGLVTTTVIEVGVDVPNATVMVVEHPERFGLTQLHQLRGRVGRGAERSTCVLLAGPRISPEARERLAVLTRTDDGFRLAEEDLAQRGAGELWGTRQTGLPALKVADLAKDADLLAGAQAEARALIEADPGMIQPGHRGLRVRLERGFGEELSWRATG
jgi:ATP-dependent DNA helicase RecG